jgi:hypothetical protein
MDPLDKILRLELTLVMPLSGQMRPAVCDSLLADLILY